jgi:hypothetical protein
MIRYEVEELNGVEMMLLAGTPGNQSLHPFIPSCLDGRVLVDNFRWLPLGDDVNELATKY